MSGSAWSKAALFPIRSVLHSDRFGDAIGVTRARAEALARHRTDLEARRKKAQER